MKNKKKISIIITSLVILVASLTFTLIDALVPLNVWTHPVLNFLFCLSIGFGILLMVLGFYADSSWYFFLSSILLGLAFFYVVMQYIPWWLGVIVVAVVWAIFAIMSFARFGNQTENIALNKSPDYKTFEQRKAENAENNSEDKKKPLPEIKSFKD